MNSRTRFGEIIVPGGMTFGPDGNLYVTDYRCGGICVFKPDGGLVNIIKHEFLHSPQHIAYDAFHKRFVVLNQNSILFFGTDGKIQPCYGSDDLIGWPSGLAVDNQGWIYVSEEYGKFVSVFDGNCKLIRRVGEGILYHPIGVAVTKKRELIVIDAAYPNMLIVFSSDGNVHRLTHEKMQDIRCIYTSPHRTFAYDHKRKSILVLKICKDSEFITEIEQSDDITGMVVNAEGKIFTSVNIKHHALVSSVRCTH